MKLPKSKTDDNDRANKNDENILTYDQYFFLEKCFIE